MHEKYLAFYETLIQEQFPKTNAIPVITQEFTDLAIPVIEQEEHKVQAHIIYNFAITLGDKVQADAIRREQLKIIHLIDDVFSYFAVPNPDIEDHVHTLQHQLGEALQASLMNILQAMEHHCASLMDFSIKVPFPYLKAARDQFNPRLLILEEQFNAAGISQELFEIIANPFRSFIETGIMQRISYQKLCYLNILMQSLLSVEHCEKKVLELLIALNFNDVKLARYYARYLLKQFGHLPADQLLSYTNQVKAGGKTPMIYGNIMYKPQTTGWTSIFERALAREMKKLEKESIALALGKKWDQFKIHTSLSAEEIACMTVIWLKAGLLTNRNKTQVTEFVATFYTSSRKEQLSPDNMRNALYRLQPATLAKVRDIFLDLVKLTKKLEQ